MYITLEELKALNISSFTTLSDEQLEYQINLISKEINEYCNTKFTPTQDIYNFDLCEKFYTRNKPLLKVTALCLHKIELQENETFFVYIDNAKININPMECENRKKALEISYIYGYEETPATVKQVLIDLLKLDIETNNSRSIGLQSENWDSEYSYSMYGSKDFTPAEFRKNILKRLDIFKVEPCIELKNTRIVRARLL